MIDPHARQPNDIANYIWIVLTATIVLLVVLSILGLRMYVRKRDARRKRKAEAEAENDKIFKPVLRSPLEATAPSRPVRKRSLQI
jgi:heme exporter protein D